MPRRPRRGSLQFWPRKRAKRIYPSVHWHSIKDAKEAKPMGFAAFKVGMTHVQLVDTNSKSPTYNKTITKAVTVLDSPSLFVLGFRVYQKNVSGMDAIGEVWSDSIPKDLELQRKLISAKKKLDAEKTNEKIVNSSNSYDIRLIIATQPKKSGMSKKKPDVFELGLVGDVLKKLEYAKSMVGKEMRVNDIFKVGEYVDVSAVTKGHGFTGTVKRFGIRIQTRKDQQKQRTPGSIGATTPRKVDWRVPMAGQYGYFMRTEFNKKLLVIDSDPLKINAKGGFLHYGNVPESFLLIEGSIPGAVKRLVILRKASRQHKKELPVDMKYISTDSKQGA